MIYNATIMYTLKDALLKYLGLYKRVRPRQIKKNYYLSGTSVHRMLKELLNEGKILKSGKKPKVYYHVVRKPEMVK